MRELLDLAVEKGFRRLIERLNRAGVSTNTTAKVAEDDQEFNRQLGPL